MKRLILLLTLIFTITMQAFASENFLNTVILEGTEGGYNVILRSDTKFRVKKTIKSNDSMILTLYGISVADNVNTLYKNTTSANNIIVESVSPDEIKVYVNAENVADANVILNTPNSAPLAIGDRFAREKLLWTGFSIMFLLLMIHYIKSRNRRIIRKMNMSDGEIEFYKAAIPSINYKLNRTPIPVNTNAKTLRQYQNLTKI